MKRDGYVYHLVLSLGTRILMILIRVVRNVLLARLLGPADRGVFALLAALPELIAAFSSGGLNSAMSFQVARQRSMGLLVTQMLVYGALLATLLALVGLIVVQFYGDALGTLGELGVLGWLLLLAVPLGVLKTGLLTLHNADGRVGPFNALRLLESFLPLVLFIGLWFVWRETPLYAAVASWLIGLLGVVVIGWYWLSTFHRMRPRWDFKFQRKLLHYSNRSHPETLFQQMLLRADYLLISAMLNPAALGFYAMASAAAELLIIVPEAVTTPLMKRLLQQGDDMRQLTPLALRVTGTVMLLACLSLALVGHWLIIFMFGIEFAPAYPALLALLPGLLGLCYSSILRLDLLGKGRPGSLSLIMGLAVVLNLVLNITLIPLWGIVGAGVASSVAYLVVAACMLGLYCSLSATPWWQILIVLPEDIGLLRQLWRDKEAAP